MTLPITDDQLAQRLAALTRATDAPATLWRAAVPSPRSRGLFPTLNQNVPNRSLAWAASFLVIGALAFATLPNLGKARSVAQSRVAPSESPQYGFSTYGAGADYTGVSASPPPTPGRRWSAEEELRRSFTPASTTTETLRTEVILGQPLSQDLPRQVIRKATIELTTPDVRAAMLKASMILNLATGEFTENSSLTGEGPTAHATLTLRIAAPRLSEALNQLRALGKVTSEQTTGDDVTDQAVDIEARLRNEQRIETELLDLLSSRKDAPLDDILAVRTQLATIRESIERLTAQRDRLSHLVSLATILVVITTDSAPAPEPAAGIWDYFKSSLATSWRSGLNTLADTAATLVRIAIGGLLWWALLLICFAAALHLYRRSHARAATEPAPTE